MSPRYQRKIVSLSTLLEVADEARRNAKVIVQCHGCFDIVHPGHVRYLEFARQQGDLLIVTLTADATISKGPATPYIPQELRAENLAVLELVDYVYIDPSPTAESVLDALRPHIYVKGAEYETSSDPGFLRERAIVEAYGGRVIFSSGETVFSSTRLIAAMPSDRELENQKLEMIRRRHHVNRENLLDALDRFRELRVAVVGDIVVDRYVFCDTIDVAGEAPMMSLAELREERFVGGAAIVARHLAALGARPFLLAATSADETAARVARALDSKGVEHHLIPSRPALVEKTRYLVEHTKLLKVDKAARVPLDSLAERRAARVMLDVMNEIDALIVCDFGYGTVTTGLLQQILPEFTRRETIVTADATGSRGRLLEFQHIDLLCPTERELRTVLNDFDHGLSSVAWELMRDTQAKHLIVTLGNRGLVTFQRRSLESKSPEWSGRLLSEHVPLLGGHHVDRLGAGDALLAVATLGLTSGLSLMQSAWLGALAAEVESAQMGNVPIRPTGLREQIARWTEAESIGSPARQPATVASVP
ncbi:MAG: adenylyltransferase/cytidyltransferase family protein [Phycisphaerales bacterium]|nr:MAG: adenylyltransferase/cytidyltransferase family protein [Phycisphaerales bacterium]